MSFLHPVFTITAIILIMSSFTEAATNKKSDSLWIVVIAMMLFIGLRLWAGADYPVYLDMYSFHGELYSFSNILNKEQLDMEWLYILLEKIVYDFGFPFQIFTLVVAIICLSLKFKTFNDNTLYPSLSLLLYMFPSYFTAEGGHMRQAIAMSIALFSYKFVKERRLLPFLFTIYIALGFHNSAFAFIIAYWLVLVPLNSKKIMMLIGASIVASPLQVYEHIGILEMLAPSDVYSVFNAYAGIEQEGGVIRLMDLIMLMYAYFVVVYDRVACEKILYYEYMRNLGVAGICLYFIFRGSPIYSSRLVGYYLLIFMMILPNIIGAISNQSLKRSNHIFLVLFAVFYYFVYANMQAQKAGYVWGSFNNLLWSF